MQDPDWLPCLRPPPRIAHRRGQRRVASAAVRHTGVRSDQRELHPDRDLRVRRCRRRVDAGKQSEGEVADEQHRARAGGQCRRGFAHPSELHSDRVLRRETVPAPRSEHRVRLQHHAGLVILWRAAAMPPLSMTSPTEFDSLVEEALSELPKRFADLLENVVVVVEEEPSEEDLEITDSDELLGLYRGIALTRRSHSMLPA